MKEIPYWMAISHLPNWSRETINRLVIKIVSNNKISLATFFSLSSKSWKEDYKLSHSQILSIQQAKKNLVTYSFLMESLLGRGYEIIPLTASYYPITLKDHLKVQYAPTVLYLKGNRKLLKKQPIKFITITDEDIDKLGKPKNLDTFLTKSITKAIRQKQPILLNPYSTESVEKQLIKNCFELGGKGIMMIPQGIMTCSEIFNEYHQQIFSGNLLIISSCYPKQDFSVEAMPLNKRLSIGLAAEMYVTTIQEKNATWHHLLERIRQEELVYVREPAMLEDTLNAALIKEGAIGIEDEDTKSDASFMPARFR